MNKSIITIVGKDKVGIIANVCSFLAKNNINILNITQTILDGFFNMMMIVDLSNSELSFLEIEEELKSIGVSLSVSIQIQKEEIFNSMHRI